MLKYPTTRGFLIACLAALVLSSAVQAGEKPAAHAWKAVAVYEGSVHAELVRGEINKNVPITMYQNLPDMIAALKRGDVDAVVFDYPQLAVAVEGDKDLWLMPAMTAEEYALAVAKEGDVADQVANAVEEFNRERLTEFLAAKWVDGLGGERILPELAPQESGKTLRYGIAMVGAPFVYENAEGKLVGLDIELARHVAHFIKMRLELVPMEFKDLIPAVVDGDIDVAGASISITAERKEQIRFTKPYYIGGAAVLLRNVKK